MKVDKGQVFKVLNLVQVQCSLKNVIQTLPRVLVVQTEAICTTELAHIVFDDTEFCLN
jgi:hypothetical protein